MSAAQAGEVEVVESAVAGISSPFSRNGVAGRCAVILASAGRGRAAVAVASMIENEFEMDETLKDLANNWVNLDH